MWHEARKREKATQKLFNDYRKRAEKRREEDKVNPNSLFKIHGLKSKLNLDPGIYKQAVKSLVPWQGDESITIDRFDVRASLSSIPSTSTINKGGTKTCSVLDYDESFLMKKLLDYERYRILIQNDLNKTPEDVRLKLVAKSDIESDAKMRKLRNNRFGTSGESSNNYNTIQNLNPNNKNMETSKRNNSRSTINVTYNSVPPPSSLIDDKRIDDNGINAMNVIDLDEFDNLELDNVDHILKNFNDNKKIDVVTKKYNLSSEEFLYLARVDTLEVCANDMIKQLAKICEERSKNEITKNIDIVYGPVLPPNLVDNCNNQSSSDDESRVQQRSPSGAIIPLREDRDKPSNDDSSCDTNIEIKKEMNSLNTATEQVAKEKPKTGELLPKKTNLAVGQQSSNSNIKTTDDKYDAKKASDKQTQRESRERKPKSYEPRRAATPIAYKKYSRSERSISRERRAKKSRERFY